MKLVSFSVTNYRSITKAHKISLNDYTVLVGRNNEGKSNLLTGLGVAMDAMIQYATSKPRKVVYSHRFQRDMYEWERDFPIQFQGRTSGLESIFRLDFKLEGEENSEFTSKTGIRCNELIPIDVKFGKDNKPKLSIPKKGSNSFNEKSGLVISFICSHISFNHIIAVRTEERALRIIERIIDLEINKLYSNNDEYKTALETIKKLQNDAYRTISNRIFVPLHEFIPQLRSVTIADTNEIPMRRFHYNFDIILDDGTPTSISNKGDGVKSLVTLALLKDIETAGASIIAIEEPESHLHPEAIHGLVEVINSISQNHQVIISTHNPLFVQRNHITQNIIISEGTAKPAKSIKEIRDLLGVLPEDNLINASHVLVVEGDDDCISLTKILSDLSVTIKDAINKNILVIQSLGGAGNLVHELTRLRSYLCKYFVFLDYDNAGKMSAQKAIDKNLLTEGSIKYTICNGSPEAEIEDCYTSDFYKEEVKEQFAVNIDMPTFKGNKKWSERMKNTFLSQGQAWTDSIEQKVKSIVANAIPTTGSSSILNPNKRGSIDSLVTALENMLEQK